MAVHKGQHKVGWIWDWMREDPLNNFAASRCERDECKQSFVIKLYFRPKLILSGPPAHTWQARNMNQWIRLSS